MGLFRHLGIGGNYIYRPKDEIVRDYPLYFQKYFQEVKLPDGTAGHFPTHGFERAVTNVVSALNTLYSGLGSGTVVASNTIKDWNLDTGVDMDSPRKEVTYWA